MIPFQVTTTSPSKTDHLVISEKQQEGEAVEKINKSAVAGVIIGVRLGIVDHRNNNAHVFNFNLDKSDCDDIDASVELKT